jgi:hypothetical protein
MRSQLRSFRRGRPATKLARRLRLSVEVLEARTVPSFAAPTAFDLSGAPAGVAVGHFEGAAAPLDVVTANANGTVSVLLGKGDGTVQNPITLTVGGSPDAVAMGDFTGNGLDDIAVANANHTVSVLLSNGNGTFQAPKSFSVGATPVGLAVGDFNGDGKLDIVTANSNGTVSVLPGKGDGAFGARLTSTTGGTFTSVAVGDFNRDGTPDLVVGTNTGLDILLGQGDGTFQLQQTVTISQTIHGTTFVFPVNAVAVSDLRGHGNQDVVALSGGKLAVLLGIGDGTVQSPSFTGPSGVATFAVGDFTGDGKPDIALNSNTGTSGGAPSVLVLAGNGDGSFQAGPAVNVGEAASALAAGDFAGTGKLDLVMASNQGSNTVTVLAGNGNGTFTSAPTITTNNMPTLLAAADFNGDGKPDLVTAGAGGDVVELLNNGNGSFRLGSGLPIDGVATALAVGDFNGDGKQDVAVAFGGTIDVFLGKGNGTFQAPKVINLGGVYIRALVAGNLSHGGLPDLAATVVLQVATETSVVQVLDNTGNGTFSTGQSINVGRRAQGLATADFNGDGKLDLVTTSLLPDNTNNVEVLLGNGNGTFHKPLITTPGFSGSFVAPGDFNGDGKVDLVLVDNPFAANKVMVLQGNGDGTFGKPLIIKLQSSLEGATPVVGGFFGDGKLSIAIASGVGQVTVLRGEGDGTFQVPVNYVTSGQISALVAADFNGDGKLDLATTSALANDVTVLLNTSPQPAAGRGATTTTSPTMQRVGGNLSNLNATVIPAAPGGRTPTGTLSFRDGETILNTVPASGGGSLGVRLSAGKHSLPVTSSGDDDFPESLSNTIELTI